MAQEENFLENQEFSTRVGTQHVHWCQLNVKPMSCKELKSLANSESHLLDD